MSWSRWSSRSLGAWPMPLNEAMAWLALAICCVSELMRATEVSMSLTTPSCIWLSWSAAVLTRLTHSLARESTTWRADMSCGWLATSTKALSNWLAA